MLRRQPTPRRPHEGTAGGDDGLVPSRGQGLVPEQAVQGQEESAVPEAGGVAAGEGMSAGVIFGCG